MPDKKPKIAIIGKLPPPIGGVTIHCQRLYERLKLHKDFEVYFYSLNQHDSRDGNIFRIRNFPIWVLAKIIKGFSVDIIHYQLANYYGLIALWILTKIRPRISLVFTVHGEGFIERLRTKKFLKKIIVHILNDIKTIITGTNYIQEQLENNGINRDIKIISAFLPPVEQQKREFPNYIQNIVRKEGKFIVANGYNVDIIGEGKDLYGFYLLAELTKMLNKDKSSFKMIILISKIDNNQYIDKLFKDVPNVYIISDNKVQGWHLISKADIMIRPTSTDVTAISIKEALSFGVYTIASDVVPRADGVITFRYPDSQDLYKKVIEAFNAEKPKVEVKDNIEAYIKMYVETLSKN